MTYDTLSIISLQLKQFKFLNIIHRVFVKKINCHLVVDDGLLGGAKKPVVRLQGAGKLLHVNSPVCGSSTFKPFSPLDSSVNV